MKAAFLLTDTEGNASNEMAAGATAVACIVRRSGSSRYVYTANCGDARAVLCHDGRAVRLSKDHKAGDSEEVNRIAAAGGFVVRGRVMGVLAVARSFGDYVLKDYVTAEPFTSTTRIDTTCQFLIAACDGLWDVIDDQEAVDMIREYATSETKQRSAGKHLVSAALERGSTDNITVMVVWL